MSNYSKPIISIDNGMAEGVYAASGASAESTGSIQLMPTFIRHHKPVVAIIVFR